MNSRQELVIQAAKAALSLRRQLGIAPEAPAPVYDMAEKLGLEVRFVDVPSLEGVYVRHSRPLIMISSHRPAGRQALTCGHEVGHHLFGHGSTIDQVIEEADARRFDPAEFLANAFASLLLMPRAAVARAFTDRGYALRDPTADQVLIVAGYLGAGYSSLITHMEVTLRQLLTAKARPLAAHTPKQIRANLLVAHGLHAANGPLGDLFVADEHWVSRAIDVQAGDHVLVPPGSVFEGACAVLTGRLLVARAPGIGRLVNEPLAWSSFVRVSRRNYVGLAAYRHMEDPDATSL